MAEYYFKGKEKKIINEKKCGFKLKHDKGSKIVSLHIDNVKSLDKTIITKIISSLPYTFIAPSKEECKEEAVDKEFNKMLGFSLIFGEIMKQKKPLVGHNMLYDLCYIIKSFVCPLPNNSMEFFKTVYSSLGDIYDTKYMAKSISEFRDSSLDRVYEKCISKVEKSPVVLAPGFPNYDGMESQHDSGCDAYRTGKMFAIMNHLLCKKEMTEKSVKPAPVKVAAPVIVVAAAEKTPLQLIEESSFQFE